VASSQRVSTDGGPTGGQPAASAPSNTQIGRNPESQAFTCESSLTPWSYHQAGSPDQARRIVSNGAGFNEHRGRMGILRGRRLAPTGYQPRPMRFPTVRRIPRDSHLWPRGRRGAAAGRAESRPTRTSRSQSDRIRAASPCHLATSPLPFSFPAAGVEVSDFSDRGWQESGTSLVAPQAGLAKLHPVGRTGFPVCMCQIRLGERHVAAGDTEV